MYDEEFVWSLPGFLVGNFPMIGGSVIHGGALGPHGAYANEVTPGEVLDSLRIVSGHVRKTTHVI